MPNNNFTPAHIIYVRHIKKMSGTALGSTVCLPSGFKDIRCQYFIYTSRHSKDIECYNLSSCISKGISYPMIFTSRHIRSPALSKAPIGLSRRTGTGQTLPVGTVFQCTKGNQWDIRQLPEPAGWFYMTTNSYHSWHRRTSIR